MSILPGPESWRDAGLTGVDPEEPLRLTDDVVVTPPVDLDAPEGEYVPDFPRPDRDGLADEADVVEQDTEVPFGDDGQDG